MKTITLALLLCSCATPTLQQRQDAWRKHVDVQRATCAVGLNDAAMPSDTRAWCLRVIGP